MAAQANVPAWNVTSYKDARNASSSTAISPNLILVADSTVDRGAKVPATSATVLDFAGVAPRSIAASATGDVARTPGDRVVVIASTGGVAAGDRIICDTASGKEGRGLTYSSGTKLMVGVAKTAADAGDLFEMEIQVQTIAA